MISSVLPVISPDAMRACQRIAHLAAQQLALRVTDQLVDPEGVLPPVVLKACGHIRARALTEDLGLKEGS